MMRRRTQGRGCPLRHGYGKCEMSDEAGLVDRLWENRRWRREVLDELAEEAEETAIREGLAALREEYRRRLAVSLDDGRFPVIGCGQREVPSPEIMARVRARREARGIWSA
jgi:hypothetical protein